MQALRLRTLVLFLSLATVFSACSPFEDGPELSFRSSKSRVENTWTVDQALTTDGRDVTSNYTNLRFQFNDNASFTITYSTNVSYSGTWYVEDDVLHLTYVEIYNGIQRTTVSSAKIYRLKNKEMTLEFSDYPIVSGAPTIRLMLVGQ